jgi:alanyl-tRNA synthetase
MSDLESRLESFIDEAVGLRKRLKVLEQASHISEAQTLLATVTIIKEVNVISAVVPDQDIKGLREIGDWLKGKLSSVLLVLAIIKDGNPIVLSMVTPDLVNRGLHAGRIVQELSKILGGGGGGGPEMAQAGGKRRDKLGEALDKVSDIVTREVTR